MQIKGNTFKYDFIFLLIQLSFFIKLSNSYIVLPLEYLPKSIYKFIPKEDYIDKPEIVMKEIYYKRLITYINIGTPSKSQMLFVDTDSAKFFLVSLNPPHQSHKETKISEFYNFGEKLFFNETESTSYIVEECEERNNSDYDEVCFAKDKIKFNFGSYQKTVDFPLKILKGEDESFPGKIGLSVNSTMAYGTQNLLSELKLYNLINDYYFFFDFSKFSPLNSQIKGNLVIGDLPHNIFPEKYSKEDYVEIKTKTGFSSWTFHIKKIEAISNLKDEFQIENTNVLLFYSIYNIIGTQEFRKEIRDLFLDKLIEEKKCFKGKFSQNLYSFDDITFYYCDIAVEKILVESLSAIKFYLSNSDAPCELTKDELYIKKGNYIYFNILFLNNQFNNWILGQIFTSKYHFVFHTDTGKISYYKKVNIINEEDETNKNDNVEGKDNKKIWTFIVSTALVFVVIGIIIGIVIGIKFIKKRRAKRAEELVDEDYDYTPKNENNVVN